MLYEYKNNQLYFGEGSSKKNLLSLVKKTGTPVYVYDIRGLKKRLSFFQKQIAPARVHYAMKANSHLDLLKVFLKAGAGVDVVSGGEIKLALKVGFKGCDIVFSGVGKTEEEIKMGLKANILQFNVESVSELKRIAKISQQRKQKARVAFRVNPDINVETHPYIKTGLREHKFGLQIEHIPLLKEILKQHPSLVLQGVAMHIGSQIHDLKALKAATLKLKSLYESLQTENLFGLKVMVSNSSHKRESSQNPQSVKRQFGLKVMVSNSSHKRESSQNPQSVKKQFGLMTFDVGGGLGIDYRSSADKDLSIIKEYGAFLKQVGKGLGAQILTEPGRILLARTACLIGEVQYIKSNTNKNFVILNTGMHHFMRPCLYQAYHQIWPLQKRRGREQKIYDVAGPVCESADVLGRDRVFRGLKEGDFMAILDTGAYGAVLSSHYNAFPPAKTIILR